MEQLQANYNIDIRWRSFELRPASAHPISPQYLARIQASHPLLEKRAREAYGLEINRGPFGINSRPALIAQKYAETQGKGEQFHKAVMIAYWQQARSINEQHVLQEIAESVGLDTADFEAVMSNSDYESAVNVDIAQAREYQLDAVPALVFAEHYLVMGAQPYEVLERVIKQVQADMQEPSAH